MFTLHENLPRVFSSPGVRNVPCRAPGVTDPRSIRLQPLKVPFTARKVNLQILFPLNPARPSHGRMSIETAVIRIAG
jgi:hypothetical protein